MQYIQLDTCSKLESISHPVSIIARIFAREGKPTLQLRNPILVAFLMLIIRGLLFPLLWLGNRFDHGDCLIVKARKMQPPS